MEVSIQLLPPTAGCGKQNQATRLQTPASVTVEVAWWSSRTATCGGWRWGDFGPFLVLKIGGDLNPKWPDLFCCGFLKSIEIKNWEVAAKISEVDEVDLKMFLAQWR